MPPHIQPRSLEELCVAKAGLLVTDTCRALERRYVREEWVTLHRDGEMEHARAYLLSYVRPLYDRVCNAVDRSLLSPCGEVVLSSLAMHNRVRTIILAPVWFDGLSEQTALAMVRDNLSNLIELRACNVRLTDQMFSTICRTCDRLEKIDFSCDSEHFELSSLNNLLFCQELRSVDIELYGYAKREPEPYLSRIIVNLRKLEVFKNLIFRGSNKLPSDMYMMNKLLSNLESPTQLRKLELDLINVRQIADIVRFCPHARHLTTWSYGHETQIPEVHELQFECLEVLAECSLQIETLKMTDLSYFGGQLVRLLEAKGGNITRLELLEYRSQSSPSLEEIYTIGSNCPMLEKLKIVEELDKTAVGESGAPPLLPPLRPFFRRLSRLHVEAWGRPWDPRVLPRIVSQADQLTSLTAINMCVHNNTDLLSELLDSNPLSELESIDVELEMAVVGDVDEPLYPPISKLSLERLLGSSPKLRKLQLKMPLLPDAAVYMQQICARVRNENLDLKVKISEPPDYAALPVTGMGEQFVRYLLGQHIG